MQFNIIIIIITELKRYWGPTGSDVLCSNSSFSLSEPLTSVTSPAALQRPSASSWKVFFLLFVLFFGFFFFNWFLFTHPSLLTIGKTSAGGLMRLAGYICPTTEEVACGVTRSRPLPKNSPPSLSPFERLQTLEERAAAEIWRSFRLLQDNSV